MRALVCQVQCEMVSRLTCCIWVGIPLWLFGVGPISVSVKNFFSGCNKFVVKQHMMFFTLNTRKIKQRLTCYSDTGHTHTYRKSLCYRVRWHKNLNRNGEGERERDGPKKRKIKKKKNSIFKPQFYIKCYLGETKR